MRIFNKKYFTLALGFIILCAVVASLVFIFIPYFISENHISSREIYSNTLYTTGADFVSTSTPPILLHITTPEAVKAIYMSACAASDAAFRKNLVDLIDRTELNAVVLDIKDFTGTISFTPENAPELLPYVASQCHVEDMKEFITLLHQKGIYVIGRITTFQDPTFTKLHPETAVKSLSMGGSWKDRNGLSYIDPASHTAWDHVIAIATSSYAIGFDEINFDYIRYPSDGNLRDMALPDSEGISKAAVIESFFSYLYDHLHPLGIKTSADLFGLTTTNHDDLGIGQVLERAMPYFDYIDPMVYPSHYPATFNGWQNPNAHPYDLIKYVMASAVKRAIATSSDKISYDPQKMRPWLQDFSLGLPRYSADLVRAEIQATEDDGLHSWLIWNAANHYTEGAFVVY